MSGRAYFFNGTDDTVDLGSEIAIAGDCTVSFWIFFTDVTDSNNQVVYGKNGSQSDFGVFIFAGGSGFFRFRATSVSYDTTSVASSALGPGLWKHIVITRVGATGAVVVYIGAAGTPPVAAMSDTDAGNTTDLDIQRFGARSSGADPLDAKLFDVQIFASVISEADRNSINLFRTPVAARTAWYQMRDTGAVVVDSEGTNNGTKSVTDPPFHYFGSDVPHDYNPPQSSQSLVNQIPFNPFGF